MEKKTNILDKETQSQLTPQQVYDRLQSGNDNYVNNRLSEVSLDHL